MDPAFVRPSPRLHQHSSHRGQSFRSCCPWPLSFGQWVTPRQLNVLRKLLPHKRRWAPRRAPAEHAERQPRTSYETASAILPEGIDEIMDVEKNEGEDDPEIHAKIMRVRAAVTEVTELRAINRMRLSGKSPQPRQREGAPAAAAPAASALTEASGAPVTPSVPPARAEATIRAQLFCRQSQPCEGGCPEPSRENGTGPEARAGKLQRVTLAGDPSTFFSTTFMIGAGRRRLSFCGDVLASLSLLHIMGEGGLGAAWLPPFHGTGSSHGQWQGHHGRHWCHV